MTIKTPSEIETEAREAVATLTGKGNELNVKSSWGCGIHTVTTQLGHSFGQFDNQAIITLADLLRRLPNY